MATLINPYRDVHKGIRELLVDLLVQCGKTDPGSDIQLQDLQRRFVRVQDLLEFHGQIEDRLLAPIIQACGVGSKLAAIETAHISLHEQAQALHRQLDTLLSEGASADAIQQFYLSLSRFTAQQFQHLADEEIHIWPALRHSCSDEQMTGYLADARSLAPPAVTQAMLAAMISATNASERQYMLASIKKTLSDQAFARVCDLSRSVLSPRDWDELSHTFASTAAE